MVSSGAIIVAGGTGTRFGRAGGKQLAPLAGRPVVAWTLDAIAATAEIDHIVLVCHEQMASEFLAVVGEQPDLGDRLSVVPGGATRGASVRAGLAALPPGVGVAVIHDGARPLATSDLFGDVISEFLKTDADGLIVGHPASDTVKVVSDGVVVETPDRERLWTVQTPQVFRADVLRDAHHRAVREGFEGTDDASLVERAGGDVRVYEGPRDNIKITTPEDIAFAESVLARRGKGEQ